MLNADIMILADAAAKRHGLPLPLVYAIIHTESGGNPWAIRYEPAFYERYIAPKPVKPRPPCSEQTESRLLACSFGLMQIMGATGMERAWIVWRDGGFYNHDSQCWYIQPVDVGPDYPNPLEQLEAMWEAS